MTLPHPRPRASRSFLSRLACVLLLLTATAFSETAPTDGFETLCEKLATARGQLADISLRSVNPFVSDEARAAAQRERETAAAEVNRYRLEYALLVQARPAFLEQNQKEVPDEVKYPAKAYEAMLSLKNALTLAAVVDAAGAKGTADAHQTFSRGSFAQELAKAATGDGNEAFARAQKFVAEKRPLVPAASPEVSKLVTTLLSLNAQFLNTTGDQETLEDVVGTALQADPTIPALWAWRAKALMAQGRSPEALVAVVSALALNSEDPVAQEAYQRYKALPALLDTLYVEGCNEVDSTGSEMAVAFGRDCEPNEERGALALRRNLCRRLYVCSFLGDAGRRAEAIKLVLDEGKEGLRVRPNALEAAGPAFADALTAAGKTGTELLAVFDKGASLMAINPHFWQLRVQLLLGFSRVRGAQAAFDVGVALDPQGDWISAAKKALAEAKESAKPTS